MTFEGPEGSGKSTLIRLLTEHFELLGVPVMATREPGAGEVGQAIRQLLLNGPSLDPKAELFLFLADRAEHMAKIIAPALDQGVLVFCDRHADSTVVYQGYGRGLELDRLRDLNLEATGGIKPDKTFLLDLKPEVGLARLTNPDRLDAEPLEFHRRVRDGFLNEASREPSRWVILDASRPAEDSFNDCLSVLGQYK